MGKLKKCSRCDRLLPIEMFNKSKKEKSGLRSECNNCRKIEYHSNRDSILRRSKKWAEENRVKYNQNQNTYYYLNKNKSSARRRVFAAVKNGTLIKTPCEVCGLSPSEAHHKDYKKPLEVQWLCKKHHWEKHK